MKKIEIWYDVEDANPSEEEVELRLADALVDLIEEKEGSLTSSVKHVGDGVFGVSKD